VFFARLLNALAGTGVSGLLFSYCYRVVVLHNPDSPNGGNPDLKHSKNTVILHKGATKTAPQFPEGVMKIPMKVVNYAELISLNQSSLLAKRNQNINSEQLPVDKTREYIINFHFDHEWDGKKDVRLSVILEPGVRTAWLDVSGEEYAVMREVLLTELEWEAAVCVGIPAWVK
jgi:hypothetical protein